MMKSRGMRWARYVASMGAMKMHFEELRIDARIILKCILDKQGVTMWPELIWLSIGSSGRLL
jgi:hypothetical protein